MPYKEKVGQPASPEREGYDFQGWYTAKDGGAKYDFGTPVTKEFTLYAHWSANIYEIKLDSKLEGYTGSTVTTVIYEKYDIQKCLIILLTKCVNSDIITIFIVKLYE